MLSGSFGAGVYLTENAEKMDQYTFPDLPYSAPPASLEELHSILYGTGEDSIKRLDEDGFYTFRDVRRFDVLRTPGLHGGRLDDRPGSDIFAKRDRRELTQISGSLVRFRSLLAETGAALKRYREFVFFSGNRTHLGYLVRSLFEEVACHAH